MHDKHNQKLWINGKPAISEALDADIQINSIWVAQNAKHDQRLKDILQKAKDQQIQTKTMTQADLQTKIQTDKTLSIIAEIVPKTTHTFKELLHDIHQFPTLLILDHLQDPHNMGAIIRTAHALGVSALIYPKDRQVQLTNAVNNASAGACYHVPLIQVSNLAQSILALKKKGHWIYGTSVTTGTTLASFKSHKPWALIVGNEQKGMSPRLEKLVDDTIHIPLQGKVSSLNVSVATGILVYSLQN